MADVDVVLAGGMRTPFGDFGKSLREVPLAALGVHAAKACLGKAGLAAAQVDHLVFGNVVPVDYDGHFVSRKVALGAGLPVESSAFAVNRACASGSQAIASAAQNVREGLSDIALAVGGENFSRVPYVSQGTRWGAQRGPAMLDDGLDYAYRCPFSRELMGETAENLTERFGYKREDMDDWGFMSQSRARAGIEGGFLAQQVAPIEVPEGSGTRLFERDEFPRFGVTREKLATLKAAFRAGGCVTAGNSSGVTDGAAAVIVASRRALERVEVRPEARVVAYVTVGVPPEIMGAGPVPAIDELLRRTGLRVDEIDYFEINEAFAVVNLHAEAELKIPRERTNLYGGGISIGHPPGATGIRMTITAMNHLAASRGRYAVISMCCGAGQGMATLIENLRY
jgi:acetyl-CoA acetyltransferase family protein